MIEFALGRQCVLSQRGPCARTTIGAQRLAGFLPSSARVVSQPKTKKTTEIQPKNGLPTIQTNVGNQRRGVFPSSQPSKIVRSVSARGGKDTVSAITSQPTHLNTQSFTLKHTLTQLPGIGGKMVKMVQ